MIFLSKTTLDIRVHWI